MGLGRQHRSPRLIQHGDFKALVGFGDSWAADVQLNYQVLEVDPAIADSAIDYVRARGLAGPDQVYEDRTWAGRNSLIYKTASGFRGELGLDFTVWETAARRRSRPYPLWTGTTSGYGQTSAGTSGSARHSFWAPIWTWMTAASTARTVASC